MDNLIKLLKEEKSVVCCNEYVKENIILNIHELIDVEFKTDKSLTNDLLGYYDDIAIFEIKHYYDIKYDRAKKIYDSLIISNELNDLKDLKEILKKYYHEPKEIKDRIIVIGKTSSLLENKLKELESNGQKVIYYDREVKNNIKAYEYKSIIGEVEDLANNICELIDKGEMDIAIYYNDPMYLEVIKDVFPFYNLSFRLDNEIDLLSIPAVSKAIFEDDFEHLNTPVIRDALIEMINYFTNFNPTFEDDIDYLKNYKISTKMVGIRVLPYEYFNNMIKNQFIIGCAYSIIPAINKDMLYYSDKVYQDLGLRDSFKENLYEKEYFYKTAKACDNLVISYAINGISSTYNKTDLLDYLKINFIPKEPSYTYSEKRCHFVYSKVLELNRLFNEDDPNLDTYKSIFGNINIYNPSFEIKDLDNLHKRLIKDGNIYMSYSKLQSFLECPFKYYAKNILKANRYNPAPASIGTIIHKFLEEYIKNDKYTLKDAINEYNDNEKLMHPDDYIEFKLDSVYYEKYNEYLSKLILELNAEKELLNLENKDILTEHKIKNYKIDGSTPIMLEGVIDKVINKNGKTIIVDYKSTDNITLNPRNASTELTESDIKRNQLYTYAILLNLSYEDFEGVYYQYIFPKSKADIAKKNFYKPDGFKNENPTLNFSSGTVISKEQYDLCKDNVIKLINEFREKALKGDFQVKPIDGACKYCIYKNLCHKGKKGDDVDE